MNVSDSAATAQRHNQYHIIPLWRYGHSMTCRFRADSEEVQARLYQAGRQHSATSSNFPLTISAGT